MSLADWDIQRSKTGEVQLTTKDSHSSGITIHINKSHRTFYISRHDDSGAKR